MCVPIHAHGYNQTIISNDKMQNASDILMIYIHLLLFSFRKSFPTKSIYSLQCTIHGFINFENDHAIDLCLGGFRRDSDTASIH